MKKAVSLFIILVLAFSLAGCEKNNNDTDTGSEDVPQTGELEFVIDAAGMDIDNDGKNELCTLSYGSTSGLLTIIISASKNGVLTYRNTFCLSKSVDSFDSKNSEPGIILNGEKHRIYVEDKRIVIDGLDPDYEGYWGGDEINMY